MEQTLHKILCSVYKLVNEETNPQSLNDLLSSRETTSAFRGKNVLKVPKVNTSRFGLHSWRYETCEEPKFWTLKRLEKY